MDRFAGHPLHHKERHADNAQIVATIDDVGHWRSFAGGFQFLVYPRLFDHPMPVEHRASSGGQPQNQIETFDHIGLVRKAGGNRLYAGDLLAIGQASGKPVTNQVEVTHPAQLQISAMKRRSSRSIAWPSGAPG